MAQPTGSASYGVKGVGMMDIASPQIRIHNGNSITISFDGLATLEADAVIDFNLGLNQPGQDLRTVSARIQGEIDPAADHATVQLWLDHSHYVMTGDRPNQSPDRALRQTVDAIAKQDLGPPL
jgi:hypothetical protein